MNDTNPFPLQFHPQCMFICTEHTLDDIVFEL